MKTTAVVAAKVIDPVCGMQVEPKSAAGKSEYAGETYYFCAPGCQQKFDADPERFTTATTAHQGHGAAVLEKPSLKVVHPVAGHEHHAAHDSGSREEAQEREYSAMMRKFWFALIVGCPCCF